MTGKQFIETRLLRGVTIREENAVAALPGDAQDPDYRAFHEALADIQQLADASDKLLTRLMQAEKSWFWDKFLKLFI